MRASSWSSRYTARPYPLVKFSRFSLSLTPPPLRSGSVPAQEFTHGGQGGSEAAPHRSPHTPQPERGLTAVNIP
jgi:hypothetical protein